MGLIANSYFFSMANPLGLSLSLTLPPLRKRESACEWRTKLIKKDDGCTSLFFKLRFLHDFLTSGLFLSFLTPRPRLDEKKRKKKLNRKKESSPCAFVICVCDLLEYMCRTIG